MKFRNSLLASLIVMAVVVSSGYAVGQVFKTALKIAVINELGNFEEGATVKLYKTEEDYRNEANQVAETMVTDKKGKVTFKELEPMVYFVNVEKGDKNNIGAGVQTAKLETGKLNKVNIVIE